jgi:nucleotide-binding universal stress UspA family protein
MNGLDVQRILVPTDFSQPSTEALELAIEFARRFGAELRLFHSREMPAYVFPDAVMPASPVMFQELERTARVELARLEDQVRAQGVVVSSEAAMGMHDQEICRHAKDWGADLIIMGTHGRTGLRHVLLGSVAERVVRRAPCPVLTVRPHDSEHPHPHA